MRSQVWKSGSLIGLVLIVTALTQLPGLGGGDSHHVAASGVTEERSSPPAPAFTQSLPPHVAHELIVGFYRDTTFAAAEAISQSLGTEIIDEYDYQLFDNFPFGRAFHLRILSDTEPVDAAIDDFKNPTLNGGLVEYAEPNFIVEPADHQTVPNDPAFVNGSQWSLNNAGQSVGPLPVGTIDADVDAPQAWSTLGGGACTNSVIGVVDSGVDPPPDLAPNIIGQANFFGLAGMATARDLTSMTDGLANFGSFVGDGAVVTMGGKTLTVTSNTGVTKLNGVGWSGGGMPAVGAYTITLPLIDTTGHGTFVSSIMAAVGNNLLGMTGLCWTAQVFSLKIGSQFFPETSIVSAIDAATNSKRRFLNPLVAPIGGLPPLNFRVLNMSFGGPVSVLERAALTAAGTANILGTAAAGNDGLNRGMPGQLANLAGPPATSPEDPCSSGLANVICVGSLTNSDALGAAGAVAGVGAALGSLVPAAGGHLCVNRPLGPGGVVDQDSGYGAAVDIAAPGLDIVGLERAALGGAVIVPNVCATSWATPHVTGIAALCWSIRDDLSAVDMKRIILRFADRLASLNGLTAPPPGGPAGTGAALRWPCSGDFGDAPNSYHTISPETLLTGAVAGKNGAHHLDNGNEFFGPIPAAAPPRPRLARSYVSSEHNANVRLPLDPDGVCNIGPAPAAGQVCPLGAPFDNDAFDDGGFTYVPAPRLWKNGLVVQVTFNVCSDYAGQLDAEVPQGRYANPAAATDPGVIVLPLPQTDPPPVPALFNRDRLVYVSGFFDWNGNGEFDFPPPIIAPNERSVHVAVNFARLIPGPNAATDLDLVRCAPVVTSFTAQGAAPPWLRWRLDYGEDLGANNPVAGMRPDFGAEQTLKPVGPRGIVQFGEVEDYVLPPDVEKVPEGNSNNVDPNIPSANLFLCQPNFAPYHLNANGAGLSWNQPQVPPAVPGGTETCAGPGEGDLLVFEHAVHVATDPSNAVAGLGAYEFSVEYDNFVIQSVNPCDVVFNPQNSEVTTPPALAAYLVSGALVAPLGWGYGPNPVGGKGAARGDVDQVDSSRCPHDVGLVNNGTCTMSAILENIIHFGCVTKGQAAGPQGDMDLAVLDLIPHPDLANDLCPCNENGVVTVLKDNGCELVDIFGHPVLGSVNGGLTPSCGDLAVTVRILEGDLNLDCQVNAQDQQLIAYRYNSFFGVSLYSKWFDLEPALHDLDIDIKDLQKVFGRDGSTCQIPIPAQPPLPPPAPFGP